MKKKILFIMMLVMTLTGSYTSETNATNSPGDTMPEIIARPTNQFVQAGQTIEIAAIFRGTPTPEVRFYKNNRRIYNDGRFTISVGPQTGMAILKIILATKEDSGIYQIRAENSVGLAETSCSIIVE